MAKRLKATEPHVPLSPGVYPATLESTEEYGGPNGAFRIRHFLVEVDGRQVSVGATTSLKCNPPARG